MIRVIHAHDDILSSFDLSFETNMANRVVLAYYDSYLRNKKMGSKSFREDFSEKDFLEV